MKGPGLRIDNDVRRVWSCPACGKESRAAGDVVSLSCGCTRDGVVMKLVEGRRQVRTFPRPPRPAEPVVPRANGDVGDSREAPRHPKSAPAADTPAPGSTDVRSPEPSSLAEIPEATAESRSAGTAPDENESAHEPAFGEGITDSPVDPVAE